MNQLIDGAKVGAWVNDPGANSDELELIAKVASEHVARMIKDLPAGTVPESTLQLACLDLAADLWDQRTAPNGVRMFTDGLDGAAPVRVRADASSRARALLAFWLAPTID